MDRILMPSLGADMTEGTVVKWLKQEGDPVKRGDKLAEIETDKTVVEMESYHAGILRKIVVAEGVKAEVGALVAYIGETGEKLPAEGESPPQSEPEQPSADQAETVVEPTTQQPADDGDTEPETVKASPMARRIAKERKIDLSRVEGSGPGGRITKQDVLAAETGPIKTEAESSTSSRNELKLEAGDIKLSKMRQAIARVTQSSKTSAPHFYLSVAVDMTTAMELRSQINAALEGSGDKLSVNDLVLKAMVGALVKNPKWNSFFKADTLLGNSDVNLGIAIALPEGLIVPAVMQSQNLDLIGLSRAAKDIGKRTRSSQLTQDELTKGTFSTSNLGMFGTDSFAAVIVPPQAGIVAVGVVKPAPSVVGGKIEVRQIMQATLSADHRVGDGAEAAVLINDFKTLLESPAQLLL